MIEMKYYRDNEYVYINNTDGITKKISIADFEGVMSGGSVTIVHIKENGALDKNWEEILGAMKTSIVIINNIDIDEEVEQSIVTSAYIDESTNAYTISTMKPSGIGGLSTKSYISTTSTGELIED